MSRAKTVGVFIFTGVLIGCAAYNVDEGRQPPRPLGRDYSTYHAPAPTAETVRAPAAEMPSPRGKTISLRDALALALMQNPELAGYSWEIRAAEARRLQAGLLPNPELSAELEDFAGDRAGFDESQVTVMLSQLVLLGGKRVKRMRLAGIERDLAGWDYESKRLDVFTQVVRTFVAVLGTQGELRITEETVRIAEDVARAASDRVNAGAASPVEETRAKVAAAAARIELERVRQSLKAARKRLAATWGETEPQFTEARGELEIDLSLPPLPELTRRISQNPDLARWAVEMDRRRAALAVEKAKAVPDVTVGAGYRRIPEEDVDTMVAEISIPLPLFDRNQGGIIEGRANLARAERDARAAEVRIATALAEVHASLASAASEANLLKTEVVPGARSAFSAIEEGYRKGKFTNLDLLESQKTLAETRSQYVRALVSLHQTKAEVERLIGEPLSSVSGTPEERKR